MAHLWIQLVATPVALTGVVWATYRLADRLKPLRERLRPVVSGRFLPDEPQSYFRVFLAFAGFQVMNTLLDVAGLHYDLMALAIVFVGIAINAEVHRARRLARATTPGTPTPVSRS